MGLRMSLWIEREFVEEEREEDVGKFLGTLDETLECEPLEGVFGWKIG